MKPEERPPGTGLQNEQGSGSGMKENILSAAAISRMDCAGELRCAGRDDSSDGGGIRRRRSRRGGLGG